MVQARNLMGSKKDVLPLSQGGSSSQKPFKHHCLLSALTASQSFPQCFLSAHRRTQPVAPALRVLQADVDQSCT